VPATQDEALHIIPIGAVLQVVLVPDGWPGS
jgi:hypothetical protein